MMTHQHSADSLEDMYQQALELGREKKLILTGLRKKVLRMIIYSKEPLSAYAMIDRFKEDGVRMTAATVYRTLDFLEQQGMIHRLASRNAWVSCITPGHSLHGQFWICQVCHTVTESHVQSISEALLSVALAQDFQIHREVVEMWGVCKSCQKEYSENPLDPLKERG